jgi:hypothetical protein
MNVGSTLRLAIGIRIIIEVKLEEFIGQRKDSSYLPPWTPPPFLHSSPPPNPPEGGKGGEESLCSLMLLTAD